ncbi:hypothetical protein [Dactylosporangium cerinum]
MNLPVPAGVDTTGYRLGPPQRAGALTMVPVFGPAYRVSRRPAAGSSSAGSSRTARSS